MKYSFYEIFKTLKFLLAFFRSLLELFLKFLHHHYSIAKVLWGQIFVNHYSHLHSMAFSLRLISLTNLVSTMTSLICNVTYQNLIPWFHGLPSSNSMSFHFSWFSVIFLYNISLTWNDSHLFKIACSFQDFYFVKFLSLIFSSTIITSWAM